MKKKFLTTILLSMLTALYATEDKQLLMVYEKGEGFIWINFYNKEIKSKYLCEGYHPQISPNGDKVAFTCDSPKDYPSMGRKIGIVDIKTGEIKILTSIPGNNNYGPTWSPDGRQIAFNHWNNNRWHIGIATSQDSDFYILTKEIKAHRTIFRSPVWAPDGKHIYFHDMEYLYKINLNGEVTTGQKITDILNSKYSISGATKFLPSKDERYLLIDPPDVSGKGMEGLTEQLTVIVLYDTKSGNLRHISPDNLYAQNPRWMNEREIIFEGVTEEETRINGDNAPLNIYKISIDTKELKLLLKNGKSPTVPYSGGVVK